MLGKRFKTAKIVEQERIGDENTAGILRGSIVWQYYVNKKKSFMEIVHGRRASSADANVDDND
jgi:hypothetical protein